MSAPQEIKDLVQTFSEHADAYRAGHLNETQVRRMFIDPFFKCLGWDIDNKAGYDLKYQDVIHEDAIKIGGENKAPDYSFRLGGLRKFFVEAKKPSVNIKQDIAPAFQLRRYAWSAKLPVSILTDFEEFAVYDCRIKPQKGDPASTARVMYLTFESYIEKWDEIHSIFSKEALLRGALDRFADQNKLKKGTSEVDEAFLEEISRWRNELAKNIALRNLELDDAELNYAVQTTIDRIIFLRICEDRGIEAYGQLKRISEKTDVYASMLELFQKADEKYNSGLFHFRSERGRPEAHDTLTPRLKIDDKVLIGILRNLYYPESPYEFSVLSADILGQVYEQFLGKVIRLTAGHHAKVEDKPEVKKAGGVFYTPSYVVSFIVQSTLGPLLEDKNPKQVSSIRVLDPSCGSGSFLIGAYQYLLDWHLAWYSDNNPETWTRKKDAPIFAAPSQNGKVYRLTTHEKKRILLANIFGVDIDPQAVEVTKLSLLLKVLEGETSETIESQLKLFRERALPDLGENIKFGNSLVSPGWDNQIALLGDGDGVFPFKWEHEFPRIFEDGGFDAIIGNPPYSYRNATEELLRPYYLSQYQSAEGNFELYKFFLERSMSLLAPGGRLGNIVSATFLVQPTFKKLRKLLLEKRVILLAPLGPNVFKNATVDTAIIVVGHESNSKRKIEVVAPENPTQLSETKRYHINQARFLSNQDFVMDYRLSDEEADTLERLFTKYPPLESGYEFGVGINTGYIKSELVSTKKEDNRYHRLVTGKGVSRYEPVRTSGWIMYDKEFVKSKGKLGRTLPAEHLLSNPKILVVRTRNLALKRRVIATIDTSGAYNLNRLSNIVARNGQSLEGLLGILNSTFFNWLFSTRFYDYEIKPVYLRTCPLADSNDRKLVQQVTNMLTLHTKLEEQKTPQGRTNVLRQIEQLEEEIDNSVFRLYSIGSTEQTLINRFRLSPFV